MTSGGSMKIEMAPDWEKLIKDVQNKKSGPGIGAFFFWQGEEKAKNLIHKANKEYDNWEQVKYYTAKEPYTPAFIWAIVKFIR